MKLKLKVSKDTKRALKIKAVGMKKTRNDYILTCYAEHLQKNKEVWDGKVDSYQISYMERTEKLKDLLAEHRSNKETPHSEKVESLREFYKEHNIHLHVSSKNAQQENIILRMSDDSFFALQMLADNDEMSIENYAEKIIQYFK